MSLAGAVSVDITPQPPVDLNGYILRFGKAQGIHDRLYANVLYIENGGKSLLLASLDLLTISYEVAESLRRRISEELQTPKEAVLLAAIHTHSSVGGPYLRNTGEESKKWRRSFEEKLIKAALEAKAKAKPSEFFAYEAASAVGVNRRKPTRGIDPNLPFVLIKGDEAPIALLINYNCHPVCLKEDNLLISADYVHFLREYLWKNVGRRFPILFFNGGAGDVDPKRRGSFEDAAWTGESLGEEVLSSMGACPGAEIEPVINFSSATLKIPYGWRPDIREAEENLKEHRKLFEASKTKEERKINGAFLRWAEELLERVKKGELPEYLQVEIALIKLGDLVLFAAPLELFSSISLKLRRILGPRLSFIISYANGYFGYLPDRIAFKEGGYEVTQWHKYAGLLPLSPEAEGIFLKGTIQFIQEVL